MPQESEYTKTGRKLPQFRSTALVALGSNSPSVWGGPAETVKRAVDRLGVRTGVIRGCSRLYRTPAFPPGSGPDFVNSAIAVDTALGPEEMIAQLHLIEAEAGRERRERWAPRSLDLDLIAMEDVVLPDPATHEAWRNLSLTHQMTEVPGSLILPHPRMQDRSFVLVPLADVAPGWVHPVLGRTVAQMLADLPANAVNEVSSLESTLVNPIKEA